LSESWSQEAVQELDTLTENSQRQTENIIKLRQTSLSHH